jgi:hypothetical protein
VKKRKERREAREKWAQQLNYYYADGNRVSVT